ncbi:MAG: hypothetical protein GWN32_06580 [Gemmatimonadetes bacterium]|nr:hypothetical protein [Gemmatimonadota bacterium]
MAPGGSSGTPELVFEPALLDLAEDRQGVVQLENQGTAAAGPIQLVPGPVTMETGGIVDGGQLQVDPAEIAALEPDSTVEIMLSVTLPSSPEPGAYRGSLQASYEGDSLSLLDVRFLVEPPPPPPPGSGASVTIIGSSAPRQGDVVTYTAEVRDESGALVTDPALTWTLLPASAGLLTTDGRFVGYAIGPAQIVASVIDAADTLEISIVSRGVRSSSGFTLVGSGVETQRHTSDLWVHGAYVYTGTWSCRDAGNCGDRLFVWNVSMPSAPQKVNEVVVDARTVNDVKVRDDGTIAVITHEGSSDGLNGITLLDLADPGAPSPITRFTNSLAPGVHNVWIDGNYVYAAVDGTGNGLQIVNISDPANPTLAASYYAGTSILHDVYVRDGLAFLSHWNAGLVILDVGNGIAGGTPESPVEVSQIQTAGGQTHNAWYWPATGYVFVGEEDFRTPGIMHVVDASDLENPVEVATFRLAGAPPHNFWLDEDRGILYAAWYSNGLRAIDVSGILLGELDQQGREIADFSTPSTWAPQLHAGLVYLSDMDEGLVIVQPNF